MQVHLGPRGRNRPRVVPGVGVLPAPSSAGTPLEAGSAARDAVDGSSREPPAWRGRSNRSATCCCSRRGASPGCSPPGRSASSTRKAPFVILPPQSPSPPERFHSPVPIGGRLSKSYGEGARAVWQGREMTVKPLFGSPYGRRVENAVVYPLDEHASVVSIALFDRIVRAPRRRRDKRLSLRMATSVARAGRCAGYACLTCCDRNLLARCTISRCSVQARRCESRVRVYARAPVSGTGRGRRDRAAVAGAGREAGLPDLRRRPGMMAVAARPARSAARGGHAS